MNKSTIARMIVFVLVWVNTFLAAHNYKTIPVVDDVQVAGWLAFGISAYEWFKHAYKWIKTNWAKKQPALVAPVKVEQTTPVIPVAQPVTPAPVVPVVAPTEPVQPTVVQPDNQTK